MSEKFCYFINEEDNGERLDKYLANQLSDFSRTRIQQLLTEEQVMVNHQKTKSKYKLKVGDEVEVVVPDNVDYQIVPVPMALDIVYEDSDIIVINKPKGLVVHPGAGTKDATLVHGLMAHCTDLSGINGVNRPGIVHRIDKDTSGLLVVAKNDKAHESLSKQLANKTMSRKYLAVVHGEIVEEYGTINAPIGRDQKDRKKMAVTAVNSKEAITDFTVKEKYVDYTLVECQLHTGRTHQIRVHMAYISHPVVGDTKYSSKKEPVDCGQLLHAFELTLIHPTTQKTMVFTAPIAPEITAFISTLVKKG